MILVGGRGGGRGRNGRRGGRGGRSNSGRYGGRDSSHQQNEAHNVYDEDGEDDHGIFEQDGSDSGNNNNIVNHYSSECHNISSAQRLKDIKNNASIYQTIFMNFTIVDM